MPPSRRHKGGPFDGQSGEAAAGPAAERPGWLRIGLVVAAAAVLLWLTLLNTAGAAAPAGQAGRLVAWSPFDARPRGKAAWAVFMRDRNPPTLAEARRLAEQALNRDPTNIDAVRVLGYVGSLRDERRARALFRYADRLSRRDLYSRLWMIEERVQANDIDGALRNFDIALKTSVNAPPILMPILVSAAQDDNIAPRLNATLRRNPPWKQAFFEPLVLGSRSRSRAVYLLRGQLHARDLGDRFLAIAAFSRFLRENDPAQAYALYDGVAGVTPAQRAAPVRDAGFGRNGELPPFDWQLTAEETLAGIRQGRPDRPDDTALFVLSEGGRRGDVARQLLRLAPGAWQFRASVGSVPRGPAGMPSVRLECVGGAQLFGAEFRALGSGNGGGRAFTVPAGCAYQWLIVAGGGLEGEQPLPWIDDIAIARAR